MLDPSYIRSIRDGILSGNIEANNNEALPDGLVGLYDKELLPPTLNWKERKETLHFFLVFALAQKEISADFTATILGDEWFNLHNDNESKEEKRLQKVNDLIQLHSKRLSSAGGGKYRLYHERFRLYILQKVSEQDISQFNNKFITLCESALEITTEKDIPENESYALEFISTHFFISAMQGEKVCLNKEHAITLKKLAYNQQYWNRQVKASKGFEWSKRLLNEMMAWASKFNEDEEIIECALNKIDLYHQEQNDAPRIVELVADGDIETALQRIMAFGGDDKEGLQRKFILYMLCLMELTLLDSKNEVHVKTSVEKLLKHFDENIPANQPDLINWNDFFPSYLVFLMACEWADLGLQYLIIYTRTNDWDADWTLRKGKYNKTQIQLLNDCSRIFERLQRINQHSGKVRERMITSLNNFLKPKSQINNQFEFDALREKTLSFYNNYEKQKRNLGGNNNSQKIIEDRDEVLKEISDYAKIDKLDKATALIEEILLPIDRCKVFLIIANQLIEQGNLNQADKIIKRALLLANELPKNSLKSIIISQISSVIYRQGKINESNLLINDAFELTLKIEQNWERDRVIKKILNELLLQGNFELTNLKIHQQLNLTQGIYNENGVEDAKSQTLVSISTGLIENGQNSNTQALINLITNKNWKDTAISKIIKKLSNKGFYEDALQFCKMINRKESRITELLEVSAIANSNKNKQLADDIIKEATEAARSISSEKFRLDSIQKICLELIRQDKINSAKLLINEFRIDNEILKDYYINQNEALELDLNNIELTENEGKKINSSEDRFNYWQEIGRKYFINIGYFEAIINSDLFESSEARFYINRSVLNSLDVNTINLDVALHAIKAPKQEVSSIEYVLQMLAIQKIFFSNLPQEKLDRYNRTLNLQWAIDIKNQLPN